MSAFVVEDRLINRVIGFLNDSARQCWLRDVLDAAEIDSYSEDWREHLGASMHMLNVDAVSQRYQGRVGDVSQYAFKWEHSTDIQVLKSLQCWLYQCAEGDVPDRPLYKAFRKIEGRIACAIVGRLPGYEKAEW